MADSNGLTEARIRSAVRDELAAAGRSLLGTALWTVLAVFAALAGLQSLQLAFFGVGTATTVGFAAVGVLVTGSSLYLLYLLYWR